MCTSCCKLLVLIYLGPFCKLDTSFKGIINPNEVGKASGDVLECSCDRFGVSPSLSVLLFPLFDSWAALAEFRHLKASKLTYRTQFKLNEKSSKLSLSNLKFSLSSLKGGEF